MLLFFYFVVDGVDTSCFHIFSFRPLMYSPCCLTNKNYLLRYSTFVFLVFYWSTVLFCLRTGGEIRHSLRDNIAALSAILFHLELLPLLLETGKRRWESSQCLNHQLFHKQRIGSPNDNSCIVSRSLKSLAPYILSKPYPLIQFLGKSVLVRRSL